MMSQKHSLLTKFRINLIDWCLINQSINLILNFVNNESLCYINKQGPGGSMSQVVELPNNSYKPITNTTWVRARLCKLQKRCTRFAAARDKVYQLLVHGRWFSPTSSTIKTGRHYIAEIFSAENGVKTPKINQSIKKVGTKNLRVHVYG